MNELITHLTVVHNLLREHHEKILSIDVSEHRLSVHLSGKDFANLVDELKPTVEGSFAQSGYHCGFDVPDSCIHIHSLLQ